MTTIHVAVDGTGTYGRPVVETASNRQWCRIGIVNGLPIANPNAEQAMHIARGRHSDSYPPNYPPRAHGNRYVKDSGIPSTSYDREATGRILAATTPHDCSNHITGGEA